MSKIYLVSFADKKYMPTLKRLENESKEFGLFDEVYMFTNKSFDNSYYKRNKEKFKYRGYGYWIWKSYFVKRVFDKISDNDILLYLDAGCVLNKNGRNRFDDYIRMLDGSDSGVLVFEQKYKESQYTKSDLFAALNVLDNPRITMSNQIWAGGFFLKKNSHSKKFIESYYSLCNNHFDLITDKPSSLPNFMDFVSHRHDQSAFSVIVKSFSPIIISADETYPKSGDWDTMSLYPILAKRNKVMSMRGKIIHFFLTPRRKVLRFLEKNKMIKY